MRISIMGQPGSGKTFMAEAVAKSYRYRTSTSTAFGTTTNQALIYSKHWHEHDYYRAAKFAKQVTNRRI